MVESLNGRLWWNPTSGLYLAFVFGEEDVFAFVVCWEGRCTLYTNWSHPFPHQYFGWILLVARVVDQRTAQHHIIFVDTLYILYIYTFRTIKEAFPSSIWRPLYII